ncbi:MAG: DUF2809 domain-containing protein [Planctomycetes bacterium]|nr:DUF2809 domain-containing protein [Planctomycetota bacterium]
MSEPGPRRRRLVAAALTVVVALGLLSRRFPLPGILAEYTGDALYATAAFGLFALLAPAARTRTLGLAAFGFAAAVEAAQLLDWPWLQTLRSHRLGALLLGQGFQWADLVAYAAGAALGCVGDVTFRTRSPRGPAAPDRLPGR